MLSEEKRKTSLKSNTLIVKKKDITLTGIFRIHRKSQKTSISHGDLHAGDEN